MNVRIRRYAEATNYAKVLTGVYNGIPKGENGMIIKYQNPPHGIARRDAIKDYRPNIPNRIRKATPAKHIQSMINIYGQSEQPTVTSDAKSPWQHQQAHEAARKGYDDYMQAKKYEEGLHNLNGILTFTDYATLATGLGSLLSKGASMAGKQVGKQMAKRAVGKEFKRQSKHLATPNNMLPNNVGWGPRQSIHVVHDKNSARLPKLYFPERWDAVNEGAPEVGIWYQGKFGNPRTAANHSIPGKAEKAAKARERFAKRPYRVEGDLELERPIVTVGDVPNRAALERAADKMSADGVIFNNVYDNGYSNNQVIFSLRDDLKNGRVFKKGAKPKVDAYYPSKVYKRTVDDVNRDYLNFIEYIDNSETMQKLADIDKELGTQYVKAVTDFKEAAKQGKLRVKSPKPGTLDIQGYPIRNPQTLTHPDIMKNPSYDYIDIDILADFPPNSVGHEFKHAIENYQAALSGIKGSVDDALFANPRLQALMKDNIVSEDEFIASMVKRYPKNDIKEIRKVYKYLTDPGEFNAQLHPLIELEQRAGKSGLPNFKDADAVNQVIKQGRASGHGGSHLDILFNNLLKPDKREEFVKQFNKYGWSLAAPAIINNRE
ncbi:hypothetical protein CE91St9_11600 [Bacteroides thetaiotaomicron]|uniref:hypothetical protein n=2 Tax=Bacteroides thetaiotaomicron TaxID=818 RepID=UPI001FBA6BA7|nr:hypothetical protein [Bacteroides thetaiotaomicron]GKH19437.1 hypothetical protein CE91St8_11720 [Bacteroides thetaiotaomicron]GKH66487.1 hypothetical protein CE91St9_11600 [Bacteroides thetaiotaomicron]